MDPRRRGDERLIGIDFDMRVILVVCAFALFLSACGKKAPLRTPEEPEEQAALL